MATTLLVTRLKNLKKKIDESEKYFGVLDLSPEEIEKYSDTLEKAIYKITEDEREKEKWKDIVGDNNNDE